jgi:hypothetical protein
MSPTLKPVAFGTLLLAALLVVVVGLAYLIGLSKWPLNRNTSNQIQTQLPEKRVANAIRFRCITQLEASPSDTTSEVLSEDGSVVAKTEGPQFKKSVRLYQSSPSEPIGPIISLADPGGSYRITALAIARDNHSVATAIGNFSNDWGNVVVWNASNGEVIAQYHGPPYLGEVFRLSFSEDDNVVNIFCGPSGGK